ncbi:MAG: DJ-1/PfpI family protein [Desulfovibrio sp.]|nr:DJ-1/PfpI family protein [Desulfovibrio sp.]
MDKISIGFLAFPGLLQLDLTAAYGVFSAGPQTTVHLVWKCLEPIVSSDGLVITPTTTLKACPQLDILCVPGGLGILSVLEDLEILNFLRKQAENANYVSSVCTGALILGAAGLLQGYKATTHWSSADLLAPFGAAYTPNRVVVDGNRITAAGVTAGIDMALTLAAQLWGEKIAKTIALNMEYCPEPPFVSGSPKAAPPDVLQAVMEKNAQRQHERAEVVARAAAKLSGHRRKRALAPGQGHVG